MISGKAFNFLERFPFIRQADEMDCGPTCLKMIAKYYGKTFSSQYLRSLAFTSREGSSLADVNLGAQQLGFKTFSAKAKYADLAKKNNELCPFLCFWNNKHFVVVYDINDTHVSVSDPAIGKIKYTRQQFLENWNNSQDWGFVLFLSPEQKFYEHVEPQKFSSGPKGFSIILKEAKAHKLTILQILLGLLTTSALQLVLPFLTQNIVDKGIVKHDYSFIKLVLLAQLVLFSGRVVVEILRSRFLLYLSSKLSIKLLLTFILKLMSLPISFYDKKRMGDIIQRINDHTKVETFITSGILGFVYAMVTMTVFFIVLLIYNKTILLVFTCGSLCYFLWIIIFSRKRATLDRMKFTILAAVNEKNLEILTGMQEIKLNNAEFKKMSEWEEIQIRQFEVNSKSLTLRQVQIDGASIINELKNLFITFIAARLVIEQQISLGVMLSVTFIIGQLNGPITIITQFLQDLQDTNLSLVRINEIHGMTDENSVISRDNTGDRKIHPTNYLSTNKLCFRYGNNANSPLVLDGIDLSVYKHKVTAIVGSSGSGKTTLMKLLLKIYEPDCGSIEFNGENLSAVSQKCWREKVGVVLQEGFIFNDSIANNVALSAHGIDQERLREACTIANIIDFIDGLPLKFDTKIGVTGVGLSTGQKQRILIARAVYKNPEILFFDEATSALDANNERVIMKNLEAFFKNKTVFIIAHRLSTVVNADQIIVLEKGKVIEKGSHEELVKLKGNYYHLIKNQLELGS